MCIFQCFLQELSSSWDGRPFGHNRHGPKSGGLLCPFPLKELGPHLTQCGLGWGLPSYQVASWSIQLLGYNRHGPKIGGGLWGGAGFPSNKIWPWPKPTSITSFILIHATVWPQHTNVTDRTDRQWPDSIRRTVLQTFYKRLPKNQRLSTSASLDTGWKSLIFLACVYGAPIRGDITRISRKILSKEN